MRVCDAQKSGALAQHGIVRVHTYFIEQRKQHDETTRVACNITTTTTTTDIMMMMMRRLADVDHHARGRERRGGAPPSPEAQSMYDVR